MKRIMKVCGMRHPDNIQAVAAAGAQWMGFIFYAPSPRCLLHDPDEAEAVRRLITSDRFGPKRVGVFVDQSADEMMALATRFRLDYLQLHGHESPELCHALQKRGYSLIKAFAIATAEDLLLTAEYADRADYFLFDTKCAGHGGSGQSFDWSLLSHYTGETPFLLSGGIRLESLPALKAFAHPRLAGYDLNSGFEVAPGEKDAAILSTFITQNSSLQL